MEITPLRLEGTYQITPTPMKDERGYFMRVFSQELFLQHGLTTRWVQENESFNYRKGTTRGLHFQKPPHAETKMVRAANGAILDVFVDLRKDSETYGQWDSVELTADNHKIVYIPKGFAHGYCTLTENAVVIYKVDEYYKPEFEGGLKWDDEILGITWPTNNPLISPRDKAQPSFDKFVSPF